jgi:hypothetical protein
MSATAPQAVLNVKHVVVSIDASGNPVCTPDTTPVNLRNVLVYASLDPTAVTNGYTFPDTGAITINTPSSDFPYPSWTVKNGSGNVHAAILDLCHTAGAFAYTVNVVAPTGKKLSVDPIIQNGDTTGGGGG